MEMVDSEGAGTINVVSPADERVIGTVPKGTREDTKVALEAAAKAQLKWEDPALERVLPADRIR